MRSILLFASLCLLMLTSFSQNKQLDLRYRTINLATETDLTQDEILSCQYNSTLYLFATFTHIPLENESEILNSLEINLLEYLGSNSYVVSIPIKNISQFLELSFYHSLHPILHSDKTHEQLSDNTLSISESDIDVSVNWFQGIDKTDIQNEFLKSEIQILSFTPALNNTIIRIQSNKIDFLAKQAWVSWIEPLPPPYTTSNLPGRTAIRSNVISKPLNGRGLTGKGINMGIWDAGQVGSHIDFNSRLAIRETDYPVHGHPTHVAGTMAGAGILDPYYKGMAPEAKIFSYDYYWWIPHEMDSAYRNDSLVITQNSYYYIPSWDTCYKRGYYDIMSYLIDRLVKIYPNYIHVYAAGNVQSQCSQGGYRTMASGPHASKNAIVVGAVDYKDQMSGFSNWGPIRDGRLKPEICGDGVGIESTVNNDGYSGPGSGTSFACPGVSGTIAQLYQLYRQLYFNEPEASTIKAIVCNTALDLGHEGPDFQYGFGRLDGLKSAEIIEKKQFLYDSISHSQFYYDTIQIDSSVKELKVMLCWSDAPTSAYKKVDSISLINHLDLIVYDELGNPYYPFILDPFNPDSTATYGIDTLNNIEQVVIKNPSPGKYVFAVEGKIIPIGFQPFSLSWHTETNHVKVTYPIGYESLIPGNTEIIRWNAFGLTATSTVEFSSDSGQNWQLLTSGVSASDLYFNWTVPAISSDKCLVRLTNGLLTSVSENCFSIMQRAEKPFADACKGNVSIWWNKLTQATSYDVYELQNEKWLFLANVKDTFYKHTLTNDLKRGYYTIKAIGSNGVKSEFATAVSTHNPVELVLQTSADTICFGQDITLTANASKGKIGSYSYNWKSFTETSNKLTDSPVKSKYYFIEVIDSCTLTAVKDSIFVFVRDPLSIEIQATADSICLGDSATLTAVIKGGLDTNYFYYWGHNLSKKDKIIVQPTQTTTFFLYLNDSCSDAAVDSFTVVVGEALEINLTASKDTICEGDELEISSNPFGGFTNSYQFYWQPQLSHSDKLKTFPDSSAYYKLTLIDYCNPAGVTDSLFVAIQLLNSNWTYNISNLNINFEASDNTAATYKWYFGDGNSSFIKSPSHSYVTKGSYTICLEIQYAAECTDSSCLALYVEDYGLNENELFDYSVYPNPSDGIIVLTFGQNKVEEVEISVRTILGQSILSRKVNQPTHKREILDLSNANSGIYFIEIKNGNQIFTEKIFIY